MRAGNDGPLASAHTRVERRGDRRAANEVSSTGEESEPPRDGGGRLGLAGRPLCSSSSIVKVVPHSSHWQTIRRSVISTQGGSTLAQTGQTISICHDSQSHRS